MVHRVPALPAWPRALGLLALGLACSGRNQGDSQSRTSSPPGADDVTGATYQAIAPILDRYCAECHGSDQHISVPLLRYGEARPAASKIAEQVRARLMPPWPADPRYRHFAD